MQFSSRTNWDLRATSYASASAALRASGTPIFDLTASNPTACGFEYDAAGILDALSRRECLRYDPDPRGLPIARQAVAEYYGGGVPLEQLFLTPSTSEAYSYLFRLHCDPGDEVLIAQPSYPLFDDLARLDDVLLVPYPLFYDHGWHLDVHVLSKRITPRTRAIVVVHPNNPTGHFTRLAKRRVLEQLCAEHNLALIVDEVFLDYPLEGAPEASFTCGPHPVLTYVLSGVSKIAGLPQMKASWLAAFGPEPYLRQALARLEMIADTFLSMNAPVQHALPWILGKKAGIQQQIRARAQQNLQALDQVLRRAPSVTRLRAEAGWYAMVRVPALASGEALALRLLEEHRVAVHPGYFYGIDGDGWFILSLLPPPAEFAEGVGSLVKAAAE